MSDSHSSHRPKVAIIVITALFVICAAGFLIDFLFYSENFDKHAKFTWENWPGFYAVYGFVACVLLVLISKYILRPLVMRDEDYYE
jgi:lysylphosphatidylglycerol synthetase-like protein (DUF2156 family)